MNLAGSALLLTPILLALVVIAAAGWVLLDARRWVRAGTPVEFRLGSFAIETPESWAALCLLVFFIFLPLYLAARRH